MSLRYQHWHLFGVTVEQARRALAVRTITCRTDNCGSRVIVIGVMVRDRKKDADGVFGIAGLACCEQHKQRALDMIAELEGDET